MIFKIQAGHKRGGVAAGHVALASAFLLVASTGAAYAQEPRLGRIAILPPASDGPAMELASDLIDYVSARLEASDRLIVSERPVIPLRDLQFSVGCTDDSAECMKNVAELLEVDTVLVLSVHEEASMTSLVLAAYDAEPPQRRSVMRLATGTDRRAELFEDVDSVLEELFGVGRPAPERSTPARTAGVVEIAAPRLEEPGASPVGWIFMGTGVASLGAGLALAFIADDTHDAWENAPTRSPAEVDAAIDLRERGERETLAASILVGVGGAALIAGLLTVVIEAATGGSSDDLVTPHGAGVAFNLEQGADR
jgi:hypothetical protein